MEIKDLGLFDPNETYEKAILYFKTGDKIFELDVFPTHDNKLGVTVSLFKETECHDIFVDKDVVSY